MATVQPKVAIVIPTIRDVWATLDKWGQEFKGCSIYIVEDHDTRELEDRSVEYRDKYGYKAVHHYSHKEIEQDLGDKAWIIPHKNASVRSYGYYRAYRNGADYIMTIDDDCYPDPKYGDVGGAQIWVNGHINNLRRTASMDWMPSVSTGMRTRGLPYDLPEAPTMVSHGLWKNVPDLDGISQVVNGPKPQITEVGTFHIPKGYFYPMCGMNLAFHRDATPLMYFLLQGRDYPYDRFDDIWAGIFSKRIMDILGWSVVSGNPCVWHDRASDAWQNMLKEHTGLQVNEWLWKQIRDWEPSGWNSSAAYLYNELAEYVGEVGNDSDTYGYFSKLGKAMKTWAGLFK